ncbi:MAG: TIGR02206 family membrane protein, partial [Solirubrobacteraceae bacterium]
PALRSRSPQSRRCGRAAGGAEEGPMELLAAEHVGALIVTALLAGALVGAARAGPGPWVVPVSRALAVVIVAAYLTEQVGNVVRGSWSAERSLPLHLTDAVTLVSALALWTGRPLPFELTYFWALAASLQAVVTPDLGRGFPHLFFWTYFLAHSGAVVAALFLAWGRRLVPRAGSVPRMFAATLAFAAAAGLGDVVTGGNYMYLREKPDTASLLDVMGPWPWYILSGAALGLALFALLDLPFRRARRAQGRVAGSRAGPIAG